MPENKLKRQAYLSREVQKRSKDFLDSLTRSLYLNKILLKTLAEIEELKKATGKDFMGSHVAKGSKRSLEVIYNVNRSEHEGEKVERDPEI